MDILDNLQRTAPSAFVFSHPNHEVAALGTITRLQPETIIYITDGGGHHRVDETKAVLSQTNLIERAVFLNRTEQSVYEALLTSDCGYFEAIATFISGQLNGKCGYNIFCDAVEFYNPVHDMTYPVVKSIGSSFTIFEVPLAYENRKGDILLQKPPEDLPSRHRIRVPLTKTEEQLKIRLLNSVYRSLGKDLETLINADSTLTKIEWFIKDRVWPILPATDQVIRYDARGAYLVSERIYSRAITFKEHYSPLVAKFLG